MLPKYPCKTVVKGVGLQEVEPADGLAPSLSELLKAGDFKSLKSAQNFLTLPLLEEPVV